MTDAHEETKTLDVDVFISEHGDRTETTLYRKSRESMFGFPPLLLFRPNPGECFICQQTEDQLGAPLQSHHFGIERCYAETPGINWDLVARDFPCFDWASFDPKQPYSFVDDMTAQGLPLCREHHIGKDAGIHFLPFSLWLMQRYLPNGYRFSPDELIRHAPE